MAEHIKGLAENMRACKKCGRFFKYVNIGYGLCPDCTKIDNAQFEKVKAYMYEHGQANAIEISEATGISERQIMQYLRDGRVEIPSNSPIFIKCEMCHTDIRYGRFCPECALKLQKTSQDMKRFTVDMYEVGETPKKNKSGKMHIKPRGIEAKRDYVKHKVSMQKEEKE